MLGDWEVFIPRAFNHCDLGGRIFMASWQDPRTGKWRYQFEFQKKKYGKAFDSEAKAKRAEARHRTMLEQGLLPTKVTSPPISTPPPSASDS
jgi:hypothetical protein